MSQMLKSSGAMGVATLTSRIMGMLREVLYARFMGAGIAASAFKTAFLIPNLFRRLLGEGALTAAFIPIFKEKEKTEGERKMWEAANAVISALIITASALIALVIIGITLLLAADGGWREALQFTPAATAAGPQPWLRHETRLTLHLTRVMFPYMLLICLAAIFMGMLNARGRFFIPALGALLMNLVLIITVLWIAPRFGNDIETQMFALALGVLVAGAAQAAYQLPSLFKEGFRFRWVSPWQNETVRQVTKRMLPGTMGVAAFQLNVLITYGIAWLFNPTMIGPFDYAVRLMELPQGVFGISLATYLLPTLAGFASEKKFPEFKQTLRQGTGYLIFANLLAAILLLVLAKPMVQLLYEGGEFSSFDTVRTAFALQCLAPGLIAFSIVNILARAFYALGDMTTPMRISTACLGVNLLFAFPLIKLLQEGGMALANTFSAGLNVYLLSYALKKKLGSVDPFIFPKPLWKLAAGGAVAAASAWGASVLWQQHIGSSDFFQKVGAVFLPIALATAAYFTLLRLLKVREAADYLTLFSRRFKGASKSNPPESV